MNRQYFQPLMLALLIVGSGHALADVLEIGDNGATKVVVADPRVESPTPAASAEQRALAAEVHALAAEEAIATTKSARAVAPPPPALTDVRFRPQVPVAAVHDSPAQVQLGAWRSQAEAEAGWNRAVKRAGEVLEGFSPHIVAVDLPKGRYYRLRVISANAGPKALCASLIAKGMDCLPARD